MDCPKCGSEYAYEDGNGYTCPMCHHFFTEQCLIDAKTFDVFGNELVDGCDVIINEDLKVGKDTLKRGTKVTNIKIIEPVNDHDISARVPGFGDMYLKSSVVKKA